MINVKVQPGYRLLVEFDNGERGMLDMAPYLDFGVFRALQPEPRFAEAKVAFGTIEWSGGLDLAPAFVYKNCQMEATVSAQ